MRKSIPRATDLLGYRIIIEKRSAAEIKQEVGEDREAFWMSLLDGMSQFAGRIMIDRALSRFKQWKALWHELDHARTDIRDWDLERREFEETVEGLCLECGKNRAKEAKHDAPDA